MFNQSKYIPSSLCTSKLFYMITAKITSWKYEICLYLFSTLILLVDVKNQDLHTYKGFLLYVFICKFVSTWTPTDLYLTHIFTLLHYSQQAGFGGLRTRSVDVGLVQYTSILAQPYKNKLLAVWSRFWVVHLLSHVMVTYRSSDLYYSFFNTFSRSTNDRNVL